MVCRDGKVHYSAGSLFLSLIILLSLGLVVWPRLGDPFVSPNPRELCSSHSPGRIPGCVYTTCLYGQIWISCTIQSVSLFPPSRGLSYSHFAFICSFRLLYDRSFRLYHHITYTFYFVSSYLLLLLLFVIGTYSKDGHVQPKHILRA